MHHTLDPSLLGRLGLRKCQWFTMTLNMTPPQSAALCLEFDFGGIIRSHHILPPGKVGIRRGLKSPAVLICLANESPETSFDHAVLQ
jgi:hypothetical protein